jgi:hypothetical protein
MPEMIVSPQSIICEFGYRWPFEATVYYRLSLKAIKKIVKRNLPILKDILKKGKLLSLFAASKV